MAMVDPKSVLRGMDNTEILNQFFNAGLNALYSGDGDAAYVMKNLVNGPQAHSDWLKDAAAVLLKDRPEFLKFFPPDFASRFS